MIYLCARVQKLSSARTNILKNTDSLQKVNYVNLINYIKLSIIIYQNAANQNNMKQNKLPAVLAVALCLLIAVTAAGCISKPADSKNPL